MTYRDKIKSYFLTGSYPTQAQFWEFFDKIPFLDEVYPSRITSTGQGQIAIPGNLLVDVIVLLDNQNPTVFCGRIAGGNDVFEPEQLVGGIAVVTEPEYFDEAGSLYFSGITPQTQIIIFTR